MLGGIGRTIRTTTIGVATDKTDKKEAMRASKSKEETSLSRSRRATMARRKFQLRA
jgi:hypothetical protein